MNRRLCLVTALVAAFVGSGCSQRAASPELDRYSDEALLAMKPAGTNALIVRALGYGSGAVTIADSSATCVRWAPEDSHYSQVCWAYVPAGAAASVTVTAEAGATSRFTGWGTGPCAGSTDATCYVPMDRDRTMNLGFVRVGPDAKTEYVLSVNVLGFVDGEISAPAGVGLACSPSERNSIARACMAVVPSTTPATEVVLTANASVPGTRFAGWGGNCSGTETCTVVMDRDKGISASFVRQSAPSTAPVATSLVFSTQPSSVVVGAIFSPAVEVSILDQHGNPFTSGSEQVTLQLLGGPGATLSGHTSAVALAGVARFADLSIPLAGAGYRLLASAAGLSSATSATFTVSATAGTKTLLASVMRLRGEGLVLSNEESNFLPVAPDGNTAPIRAPFPLLVDEGGVHVTVASQPFDQTCDIPSPSGSGGGVGFTQVDVVCSCNGGLVPSRWSCVPPTAGYGEFIELGSHAFAVRGRPFAVPVGAKALVGGGAGAATVSAEVYESGTRSFSPTGTMVEARSNPAAAPLPGGKVLVVGGWSASSEPLASAEVYDPATGEFTLTGSMSAARGHPFAVALSITNGKVLVVGGMDAAGTTLTSAELYDPSTGTFAPAGSTAAGHRDGFAVLLNDGKVLVAAGEHMVCPSGGAGSCSGYINSAAEQFDPAANGGAGGFAQVGSVPPLRHATATTLLDGTVLVAGGIGLGSWSAEAGTYDPKTGSFSAVGEMALARGYAAAARLSSGNVLIAGGWDNYSIQHAELFDHRTKTFTPIDNLSRGRSNATAVNLGNEVLIVGRGWMDGGGGAAAAEVLEYDATSPLVIHANTVTTSTTALIFWITNEPATTALYWGLGTNTEKFVAEDTILKTEHSVLLEGLAPRTIYSYITAGHDFAGNIVKPTFSRAFITQYAR